MSAVLHHVKHIPLRHIMQLQRSYHYLSCNEAPEWPMMVCINRPHLKNVNGAEGNCGHFEYTTVR